MDNKIIKILYVEDEIDHAILIGEFIKEIKDVHYEMTHVQQLEEALLELDNDRYDIVMLDMSLPDKQGLDTVTAVCERAPEIPVVVMTSMDDESMAIKALQRGAEEYLVKGDMNSHALSRILRYSIMRHKGRVELQSLSLIDDLTSLYNRRGFMLFSQQQLSIAIRTKRGMILFFIHIPDLNEIIEKFGHQYEGLAKIETANILKEAFRESDIIARHGRDEFTAMAIESFDANNEIIITRLQDELEIRNKQENRQYKLSLCIGTAYYDTEELCTIDELINRAKMSMIEQKENKLKS
ncbi:MAG: GGDEF domain-containing response regulator [Candidatus Scalindua rubra]|uniref:Two-component sensor kinase n=1 Tax=Candidatus Scalindua brodae TaxID=237368 RepID=A0A0B0EF16_9BACT|nr:MAG: two-component sensor kinase [Candidatus Scalindua brodae]MBZ0107124.1 GGDEF domain-containing response regulator [Candidatus Scalindua rubra]TWU38108.1 Transcriptional activator protein CopR [Candidatus Brocadiaceae bacterium S225]